MYCGIVLVVCENRESVVDAYEVFNRFGSVIVVCE
jgi:hypothetical protein